MRVVAPSHPAEIVFTRLDTRAVGLRGDELLRLQPLEIELNGSAVLDLAPSVQRDRNIDLAAGRVDKIQHTVLRCAGIVAELDLAVRGQLDALLDTGQNLRIPVKVLLIVEQRIVVRFRTEIRELAAHIRQRPEAAVQHEAENSAVLFRNISTALKQHSIAVVFQCIDLRLQVNERCLNRDRISLCFR